MPLVAALVRGDRRCLLVMQRVGPVDGLREHGKLFGRGAGVADVADAVLHCGKRGRVALVEDAIGRVAGVEILPGMIGEPENLGVEGFCGLIEPEPLLDGSTLAILRGRRQQHRCRRGERQHHGRAVSPVGNRREAHDMILGRERSESVNPALPR